MYILTDTFNGRELSRHRTIDAAVRAQRNHLRAVKRANEQDSYLTYSITRNGEPVEPNEIHEAEDRVYQGA